MLQGSWCVLLFSEVESWKEMMIVVVQEGDVNPFTKQPHTAQYKKILEARKKLPVYAQMTEFYKMVSLFMLVYERGGQSLLQARDASG